MLSNDIVEKLLGIPRPWKIRQVSLEQAQQQLVIDLVLETAKRGWFGRSQRGECPVCGQNFPLSKETKPLLIRHINLGAYRVYLRLQPPPVECNRSNGECPLHLEVAPSLSCTHKLEQQVRPFWGTPQGGELVGRLLNLTSTELNQLRKASLQLQPASKPTESQPTEPTATSQPSASPQTTAPAKQPARQTAIPAETHPAWERLIDRQITLQTSNFGLQMLLTWACSSLQDPSNEAAKLNKINLVRGYFEKHQRTLSSELKQLFG